MAPNSVPPGSNPPDDLPTYLGLTREEAERRAHERGWTTVRSLPPDAVVTLEYVLGRLNFIVADDHVQRCWPG